MLFNKKIKKMFGDKDKHISEIRGKKNKYEFIEN